MDGFYLMEAREVSCVKGQDALHAMDVHGSDEPRVMNLDSGDSVVYEQPAPFIVNR